MLEQEDREWLTENGYTFEVVDEGGITSLILKGFPLPPGFDRETTDLLTRLPPGFPDTAPDMFWVDPPIKIAATGVFAPAANVMESYINRTWQRFSRHFAGSPWRPGIDSLQSWVLCIRFLLEKDVAA